METSEHQKQTTNRSRQDFKKTTSRKSQSIKREIEKVKKSKIGVSTNFLSACLRKCPNFIGVFPQDTLQNMHIRQLPVSFIINLDLSNQTGSHWIAVYITKNTVEVWDSLALSKTYLKQHGKYLLRFLKQFKLNRTFFGSKKLQSDVSNLCGFYCLFFLIHRQEHKFKECQSYFTDIKTNDDRLSKYFSSF